MRQLALIAGVLVVACAALYGFCAVTHQFVDPVRVTFAGAAYGGALALGIGAAVGGFYAVLLLSEWRTGS